MFGPEFLAFLTLYAQLWTIGSLVYAGGYRDLAFAAGTSVLFYVLNVSKVLYGLVYYVIYAALTLYFMQYYTISASVPIRYLEGTFVPVVITLANKLIQNYH